MEIDLSGKVAIVTGAGRGIGRCIAETFVREGVQTVALDNREDLLAEIAQAWAAQGWSGRQILCDVSEGESVSRAVAEVEKAYGRIDILVNNAGIAAGGPIETLPAETWDDNCDANLKGTFLMCRAVIPAMKRQRSGRILNAASFAALIPSLGGAAYAASKAGVVAFTRVLAGELGPWNVTANSYAPGMIPTQMNRFAQQPQQMQTRLLDTLTLRRWGQPQEVANLLCFLASDLADYITGALIEISGGKYATQIPRIAYEKAAQAGEITLE